MTTLREHGESRLRQLLPLNPKVSGWRERLLSYSFTDAPEDPFVWMSCVLALEAMNAGNYGVGALIVRDGRLICEGQNRLFTPYFRTDLHAEMDAINRFEMEHQHQNIADGFVLYSSLECCPMCTVRLINSGIRAVRYAAPDETSGMVHLWEHLPPFYQKLAAERVPPQVFSQPDCSPLLIDYAARIFLLSDDEVTARLSKR